MFEQDQGDSMPAPWFPDLREVDFPEVDLPTLLDETWKILKQEMETNHSTQAFVDLRKEYGDKLRAWWARIRAKFLETARVQVDLGYERTIEFDDEKITLSQFGEDAPDDDKFLDITQSTPMSENTIRVTMRKTTGVDTFMYPPTIKSRVRGELGGDWLTYWEVVFRGSAISTITRTRIHENPEHQLPYIKQTEIIDASLFGVDIPALEL